MTSYFFDNCTPYQFVDILRLLEYDVVHCQDIWPNSAYPEGVEDPSWIPEIARLGRIVITSDLALTKKPAQIIALQRAKLTTYIGYAGLSSLGLVYQARWFVRVWSKIEDHVEEVGQPGHAYVIRSDGKIDERNFKREAKL